MIVPMKVDDMNFDAFCALCVTVGAALYSDDDAGEIELSIYRTKGYWCAAISLAGCPDEMANAIGETVSEAGLALLVGLQEEVKLRIASLDVARGLLAKTIPFIEGRKAAASAEQPS